LKTSKRATVYFEPEVLGTLRLRAVADDHSISELVNEAVRAFLAEDLADLSAFDRRRDEPSEVLDDFLRRIKFRRESVAVTEKLNAIHGAPGVDQGLDPVITALQSTTLAKRFSR
jgi:hypothetical protein